MNKKIFVRIIFIIILIGIIRFTIYYGIYTKNKNAVDVKNRQNKARIMYYLNDITYSAISSQEKEKQLAKEVFNYFETGDASETDILKYEEELMEEFGDIINAIYIIDDTGKTYDIRNALPQNISTDLQQYQQGFGYLTPTTGYPFFDPYTGKYVAQTSWRANSINGHSGVIFIESFVDRYSDLINKKLMGEEIDILFVDTQTGVIVADPKYEKLGININDINLELYKKINAYINSNKVDTEFEIDGECYYLSKEDVSGSDWVCVGWFKQEKYAWDKIINK